MDFAFSEDQLMLRALARGILEKEVTPERLREAESGGAGLDRRLWATLAEVGLLGVAVPEAQGGSGLGLVELGLVLAELGRALAPVPALATLALGALPIARFGSEAQRARWLPAVAAGDAVLSAALVDAESADPTAPATRARRAASGWVLDGRKLEVPAAQVADRVLVPAATPEGIGLFLLDPHGPEATCLLGRTSTGEPLCTLVLAGASIPDEDLLGADPAGGRAALAWLHEVALVGVSLLQLGVCERALEITAGYVAQREQFGVPIGSFQAVQHRAADAWIDLECLRWTAWHAAWRLAAALPVAREAAVAKFWAAEAGARIAATAQHLHAGIGVDRDYPIHRYFLASKQLELALGGATPQLARLGRDLAASRPEEIA